jgi:predicted RNA-binding Zn-ribbon protein involved in translation (DUF1610 family)
MDHLDRLFQRLAHNIRTRDATHLSLPFTVAELYEQIVPYRHNRRELGIESNQDYELTVMRLLSGERGYLLGDAAMQDALKRELESRDPDIGSFREYAGSEVSISPAALQQLGGSARRPTPRERTAATGASQRTSGGSSAADADGGAAAAAAMAADPPTATGPQATAAGTPPATVDGGAAAAASAETSRQDKLHCRFCGTTLPEGREVKFCPKCGQNLAISRCPACGSDIEADWEFCITCGRAAGE